MSKKLVRANPPGNYRGGIECWKAQLQALDLWDGAGSVSDVFISQENYDEVLESCEAEIEEIEY